MPYNDLSENQGRKGNDNTVHDQAADDVQGNCLAGASGGIEISGDHGVDAADDEAPAVFPQMEFRKGNGFGVAAEQPAKRVGEEDVNNDADSTSDDADELTGPIIMLQILLLFRAVCLTEQRLHAFGRAEEHRHGKAGQVRDDGEHVDADLTIGSHQGPVHAEGSDRCGELGNRFRKSAQDDFAVELHLRPVSADAQLTPYERENGSG